MILRALRPHRPSPAEIPEMASLLMSEYCYRSGDLADAPLWRPILPDAGWERKSGPRRNKPAEVSPCDFMLIGAPAPLSWSWHSLRLPHRGATRSETSGGSSRSRSASLSADSRVTAPTASTSRHVTVA